VDFGGWGEKADGGDGGQFVLISWPHYFYRFYLNFLAPQLSFLGLVRLSDSFSAIVYSNSHTGEAQSLWF
jgi:hypothetical protein